MKDRESIRRVIRELEDQLPIATPTDKIRILAKIKTLNWVIGLSKEW